MASWNSPHQERMPIAQALFEPCLRAAPHDDLQPIRRETEHSLLQWREAATALVVSPKFAFNSASAPIIMHFFELLSINRQFTPAVWNQFKSVGWLCLQALE